ncbi:MAG TPA: HNH endonuclease signature motif containing protein [Pirellulaceae bacterium]|nr:HNH endonuclease signature motif containing protein [Pirellulaceae bacterium]
MSTQVSAEVQAKVRAAAKDRCGYCLCPQRLHPEPLEIDHIVPQGRGGGGDESNLWMACGHCNGRKSARIVFRDPVTAQVVPLFNPRTDQWHEHFSWNEEGVVISGLTAIGRATVHALQLNHPRLIVVRMNWARAGWHPPDYERANAE